MPSHDEVDEDPAEEEEERPRPKKNRRRDDDEPKSKQKKANASMLWIVLGAGGVVLVLLLCCGCGVGGYFLMPQGNQSIVGRWENKGGNLAGIQFSEAFVFREDGSGTRESKNVGVAASNFKYRVEEASPRMLVILYPPMDMVMPGGKKMVLQGAREERMKFRIRNDVLTLTHSDIGGEFDLTYNRTK